MTLARQSGPEKTFCPSEAARALAEDWRLLMDAVREAAAELVAEGRLRCTQKGKAADPLTARGPIRLAINKKKEANQ